ncbi:hypothetical protein U1Q18_052533 [Sarracenia purpurea var. burkii]
MPSHENVKDMFTRFNLIINNLKSLGKVFPNIEIVRKILRTLPEEWRPKVTAIEEAKDLTTLSLDDLMGSLFTHEFTLKKKEEDPFGKKKNIALKATKRIEKEEETKSDDEKEEKEVAYLSK